MGYNFDTFYAINFQLTYAQNCSHRFGLIWANSISFPLKSCFIQWVVIERFARKKKKKHCFFCRIVFHARLYRRMNWFYKQTCSLKWYFLARVVLDYRICLTNSCKWTNWKWSATHLSLPSIYCFVTLADKKKKKIYIYIYTHSQNVYSQALSVIWSIISLLKFWKLCIVIFNNINY